MIFWNSEQTKIELSKGADNLIRKLDRRVFGPELIYSMKPEKRQRLLDPMSIYAAAVKDDVSDAFAYISFTIVTERYYQDLLKGIVQEEDFEPWDDESKDTPLLFLRNLVVRDRRATPYIFRYAIKDLHKLCDEYDIYLHRVFTIATHWVTQRALKLYDFEEVGKYQNKYPILLTSRDKSVVFNSYMKKYRE